MITPDASIVVAAFAPWHAAHQAAKDALGGSERRRLIAHVAWETVSTLSRMPEGRRVAPGPVNAALEREFPSEWLCMDGATARRCLRHAVDAGARGGALYDALIAATAAEHGARLVSADRRALLTYDAVGVDVTVVS